jgi:peptide-methionine (S)-S-oxide reductase
LTQFSLRAAPVYRRIELKVYQKSTEHTPETLQLPGFRAISGFSADYHQQYLAKNPNGYCGIGGCGVPFKLAELQVGEKA